MRYIILGCTHLIGSSLLRLILKLGLTEEIVMCSIDGKLPEGTIQKGEALNGDVQSALDLKKILKKGDVVFNGQQNLDIFDYKQKHISHKLHYTGLINLLKICNEQQVAKVFTYIPAILTWKSCKTSLTETSKQVVTDELYFTFQQALEVCEAYWNKEDYVGSSTDLQNHEALPDRNGSSVANSKGGPIPAKKENAKDSLSSKGKVMPKLLHPDKNNKSIMPNLRQKPETKNNSKEPSRDEKQDKAKVNNMRKANNKLEKRGDKTLNADVDRKANKNTNNDAKISQLTSAAKDKRTTQEVKQHEEGETTNNTSDKIIEQQNSKEASTEMKTKQQDDVKARQFRTELTVIRGGILFGAFEQKLTPALWKSVRLNRIIIQGAGKKIISWTNPEDVAIAMLQSFNFKLRGQYMVKSFDASLETLINEMDKVNHSSTIIIRKRIFLRKFLSWLNQTRKKEHLRVNSKMSEAYLFSSQLQFDDAKARKDMYWNGQKGIVKAVEESFEWFNSFIIAKKKLAEISKMYL